MSRKHPIIAVTGSSGAGTTAVRKTFENIFRVEHIQAALIGQDLTDAVRNAEHAAEQALVTIRRVRERVIGS